ncbi:tetratricopeptide repeat protein [Mycobacterium sp. 4D054]|uniref:tetratricopeptide repeat protein n=1 Tax=unclassified Mycobacterium TaxID=2642494 RepID=UPI0021B342A0|nr:tetratricopeptide repeat protein [Mycobacterium sp. SMC-8]UXA14382.1 tetratricopeptide repeat protein [Mycobacterium sp. SMC-8]
MSVSTDEDHDTGKKPDAVDAAEQSEPPAAESGAKDEPDTTGTRDGRRSRVVRAAVAAAFVVLLAAVGFLGWQLWQERQIAQAGEQARQAAAEYAQVLTSIDSSKVDENFDAVLDGATGEFKDMYSQSSTELRQLLIDNKAAAHGVVLESAVQSASKDKAVVLLFVDQSVTNTNVPDPRIDRSRIKMTMDYIDGRWRASKVELP